MAHEAKGRRLVRVRANGPYLRAAAAGARLRRIERYPPRVEKLARVLGETPDDVRTVRSRRGDFGERSNDGRGHLGAEGNCPRVLEDLNGGPVSCSRHESMARRSGWQGVPDPSPAHEGADERVTKSSGVRGRPVRLGASAEAEDAAGSSPVDLQALYQVIRSTAVCRGLISYRDLSLSYSKLTGATPQSSRAVWDDALKELSQRLFAANPNAPAIGALVIYAPHRPGPPNTVWGSAPNAPRRRAASDALWERIVDEVYDHNWPPTLP